MPAANSRTGIGSHGVAGLELPSLEAIKLLLARYPGLGPALQQLDWDDHGRISKSTLMRIILALEGDQLLGQGGTTSAPALAPTPPAPTAQLWQQHNVACAASITACAGIPAGSPGLPIPPAAAPKEVGTGSAQVPAASPAAPAAAAAASTSSGPELVGFASAWGNARAGPSDLSTVSVGVVTSASTPTSACGGSPAAGAGTISSAGSSRRTSLRPTLSIDISSLRVSDSSDSSGDGDSSSKAEPPAPAPSAHAAGSHSGAAVSTMSRTSARPQHAAAFAHTPALAGNVHESSSGDSHAEPAALSTGSGVTRKHCSTTGIALRAPMQLHGKPLQDGPDAGPEDDSYRSDEGPADPTVRAAHSTSASSSAQNRCGNVAAGKQITQKPPARCSSKAGRKAQTPAAGLGKPVSIFSANGSTCNTTHAAAHAGGIAAQGLHAARAIEADESEQGQCHSWHHELSKRPPTPGVSLSQPVSVFSGSGSSLEAGLAYQGQTPQHTGSSQHSPFANNIVCFNARLHDGNAVSFAQHPAFCSQARPTGSQQQHQQDRPHSAPGPHGQESKACQHHKPSKRAPTPGAALGKSYSIFSGGGGQAEPSRRSGSESDVSESWEPVLKDSSAGASGQHLVTFADAHGFDIELEPGASSKPCGGAAPPAAAAAAGSPKHKQLPAWDRQHEDADAEGHWHHKLSKRAPTPGASLAHPVSIFSGSGRVQLVSSGAEDESAHVTFAEPSRQHASMSCGSRRTSAAAAATASRTPTDAAAAAAAAAAASAEQHHWDHKLSKRPSTPGVSLGKPVSIFSASGASPHNAAGRRGSSDSVESDSTCNEEVWGHVHFAAPCSNSSRAAAKGATGSSKIPCPPADSSISSDGGSSAATGPSGKNKAAARRAAALQQQLAAQQQHEQQRWHHKLSKSPPTPGASLGQPVSIFSSNGRSGAAAPAGSFFAAPCCSSAAADVDGYGVHIHSGDQPVVHSSSSPQHSAPASGRRISWGNEAEVMPSQHGSPHEQPAVHHARKQPEPTAHTAAAGSASGASSGGRQAGSERRRITWGDDAAGGSAPGGSSSAAGQHQERRVTWGEDGVHAGTSNSTAGSTDTCSSAVPQTEGRSVTWGDDDGQGAATPSSADETRPGPGGNSSRTGQQQQQQQHEKDKPGVRPATPGWALGQQPESIFLQHANLNASAAASPAVSAAGAEAAGVVAARACSAGPGLVSRLNPDLAAEAAQQKWLQHMADRPPTPGAPLQQQQHNIFAEPRGPRSPRSAPVDGCKLSRIPPAPLAAATSSSAYGSSSSSSSSNGSMVPGGTAQQALLRLSPELAAEAQQQRWQQHMANRPPTPGAGLLHHPNIFAADADADAAGGSTQAALDAGSSSSPAAAAPPGRPSASKQALLRLSPELAAEAQEQKWQRHMTNRPPTPGASLWQHNVFADDDSTPDPTARTVPSAPAPAANDSVRLVRATSSSSNMSRIPSNSSIAATAAVTAQQALLKLRPELAAEAQEQKWQQHMANRPPTPGASLLIRPNIFAEADAERNPPAAAAVAAGGGGDASRSSSIKQATQGLHGALLLHNPDLVIEKQQEWEHKLSRRPPTPAATLGKNHNMFADDRQDQAQPAVLHLPVNGRSSGGGVSGAAGPSAVMPLPGSAAVNRSRSPDQARTASSSSGGGSSPGCGASPTDGVCVSDNSSSSSSRRSSRSGSSNPGRQRGSSPLRNTTTAAAVAEQQDRATQSPLRHSSSMCDPDPARMSPLGRRTSASGASTGSSTPSTPTVTKTTAAPASTPAVAAVATAAMVEQPAVGGQAQEAKAVRQSQLGGAQSEQHSPSRLALSASPSGLAREPGRTTVAQRSSSPLSRSRSSSSSKGQGAEPVRHGSPLSRCSSGGYN